MDVSKALHRIEQLGVDGKTDQAVAELNRLKIKAEWDHQAFHRHLLKLLDRIAQGDSGLQKNSPLLRQLLMNVDLGEVSERLVRYFTRTHDYSESFRDCMIQRNGAVSKQTFAPEFILSKEKYRSIFAQSADIKLPRTYQSGVRAADLEPTDLAVIKPLGLSGSRGINIVERSGEGYLNRVDEQFYSTWADFTGSLHIPNTGHKRWDGLWVSEELIESPFAGEQGARDIKVYAFYGEVACILEISRWESSQAFTWYDRDLRVIDPGIYSDSPKTEPLGLTEDTHSNSEAERISALIPAPFTRLDFFLSADHSLVLGELSFRPGAFHRFSTHFDRELGSMYKHAEARLLDDLVSGKSFPEYEAARLEWERSGGSHL